MICIILSLIAALIWTALIMFVTSFLTLAYEVLSSTSADVKNRSYKDADTYNIGVYLLLSCLQYLYADLSRPVHNF